jgi:transglutaminase-like putative cysteine protease
MINRVRLALAVVSASALCVFLFSGAKQAEDAEAKLKTLIDRGDFSEAEKILRTQVSDASAPITTEPAIQLEVLRRTRYDFALTDKDVLAELKQNIPDATQADVDHWRKNGDLQSRVIDGENRYFRRAVSNLFRFNAEAKRRQQHAAAEKKYNTRALVEKLVSLAEASDSPEIYPIKHRVHYEITVHDKQPLLKNGSLVRAWLPFPQEYRQQKDVKLVRSDPLSARVASKSAPQRSVYFEQRVSDPSKPPHFDVDFEFVTSAYYPKLDPAKVRPYDTNGAVYRKYTAERPPHIVFTPQVKQLDREIVGDETNPLEKALRIFRWVSKNVPWCAEQEYSIIPSLSVKGLTARRGDCGVQGTSFITLCRAAGVPARWQSGWQTKPGDWNMHDWSEFYLEPWGWLPADASYGIQKSSDPRVRDFFCGHFDPYRLIVNLDYGRPLEPPKTSFRSEPTDFQRGEVEIDGHNLYFDQWDWKFDVKTEPVAGEESKTARIK